MILRRGEGVVCSDRHHWLDFTWAERSGDVVIDGRRLQHVGIVRECGLSFAEKAFRKDLTRHNLINQANSSVSVKGQEPSLPYSNTKVSLTCLK